MCSVRFAFLPLMSALGLTIVSEQMLVARERLCNRCFLSVQAPAVLVPTAAIQPVDRIHAAHVAPVESEAKLVLNCPADARVTIEGYVTHASGKTRQYRLLFRGDEHKIRVGIRLRDNKEEATFDFDHPMVCRRDQTIVLSVTRDQMLKTPDATSTKSDSEPPVMSENPTAIRHEKVQPLSALKRVAESQTKILSTAKTETTRLAEVVGAKATRRDQMLGAPTKADLSQADVAERMGTHAPAITRLGKTQVHPIEDVTTNGCTLKCGGSTPPSIHLK